MGSFSLKTILSGFTLIDSADPKRFLPTLLFSGINHSTLFGIFAKILIQVLKTDRSILYAVEKEQKMKGWSVRDVLVFSVLPVGRLA